MNQKILEKIYLSLKKNIFIPLVAALCLLNACAATTSSEYARAVNDPFEPVNRATFEFNRIVDAVVLKPVAMVYRTVLPPLFQDILANFFSNLASPVVFFNNLLQADFDQAGMTLGRFMTNTVFGFGGTMDIASRLNIPKSNADFGMTMAKWGVQDGPYLVLPFFGPANARDAIGLGVDFFMNPLNIAALNPNNEKLSNLDWIRFGVEIAAVRAGSLELLDDLERNSVDLYAATRTMYRQNREYVIHGKTNQNSLDYDFDFNEE